MKLIKSKGLQILEKVAVKNGVTVEEVRSEIQKAIDLGIANPDPDIKKFWNEFSENRKPSPEELILYLSKQIKNK